MPVWNFSFSLQVGRRQQNGGNGGPANEGITDAAVQNATVNIEHFQQLRNRLFHQMFYKFSLTYARAIPIGIRRLLEFIFLLKAVGAFILLIYIHMAFTKMPCTCLSSVQDKWPKDGILRVDIQHPRDSYDIQESYAKELYYITLESEEDYEIVSFESQDGDTDETCISNIRPVEEFDEYGNFTRLYYETIDQNICIPVDIDEHSTAERKDEYLDEKHYKMADWPHNYHIMEFAMEYGFLRLSQKTRERLQIPIMLVTIDPHDEECFGNIFSTLLLKHFLGYDNVLMGALRDIAEKESGKGYLRNVLTGDHFKFVNLWMSQTSYLSSFFVMIVFTLSVSLLLRYSHHQIFVFIVNLLQLLEFNTALVFPAGPLLAVVLALIGIEAIMSEFFGDTSTAFYVILILWVAEQFDAMCNQSNIVKKHWLKFFFLYHYAFYAYHYRFNGQNGSLALMTSWFFIQHSMLYFYHHYELPLVLRQNHVQEVVRRQVGQFSFVRQAHRFHPTSMRPPVPPAASNPSPTVSGPSPSQEVPLVPEPVNPVPGRQDPLDDREITRLVDELSSTLANHEPVGINDNEESSQDAFDLAGAPTIEGAAVVNNLDPTRVFVELEPDGILLDDPVLD